MSWLKYRCGPPETCKDDSRSFLVSSLVVFSSGFSICFGLLSPFDFVVHCLVFVGVSLGRLGAASGSCILFREVSAHGSGLLPHGSVQDSDGTIRRRN